MKYFNLHTHNFTNQETILEVVNQYPKEFDNSVPNFSIGIHPWHIDEATIDNDLLIIESQLQNPKCLAIGECGLDKRIEIATDLQIQVFEKQLLLAQKYAKPVVVHCVAAFQEVIAIKNKLKITVPIIIHGFSKNSETAKSLIDNGFYLSFGKYLIQNPALESVFSAVPNDRFFLETDTINQGIEEVYALAATYKKISISELHQIINQNIEKIFNISIL